VPTRGDQVRIVIDAPSGRHEAEVSHDAGRVGSVSYTAGPMYVAGRFIPLQLSGDVVSIDMAYVGVYLAVLDTAEVGVTITPGNAARFAAMGREIAMVLRDNKAVVHPTDHRLSGLGGTLFYEQLDPAGSERRERSIVVWADGRVGRYPSGVGVSARLALLDTAAELARGARVVSEGPSGTTLSGRVVGDGDVGGIHGVLTEVTGTAHRTGEARVWLDELDPVGLGIQL
jgi:proline racemase